MADPNGYLMRFRDGPMSQIGNVDTVASKLAGAGTSPGDFVVPRKLFGWPLPDHLHTLCHPGVAENAAMWPEGEPGDLPIEIVTSPNVKVYKKVSQSALPDDSATHVMRGAEYELDD